MRRNGFTLVEMLIALSIFGMLTAAGVALLGVSARTQETSDRLLAEVGETRRLGALLGADLALAVPRIHRDEVGRPLPAFAGGADSLLLLDLVRRGWDEGEGASLQRVGYRLRDGRLERLAFPRVDGGGEPVATRLIDGVGAIRLRFRDDEGEWRGDWAPTDPTRLPTAVELVTRSSAQGTIRQLFLVGVPQR